MIRVLVVISILLFSSCADAQTRPSSSLQEVVDAAYALGLQTGQSVAAMLKEKDDRLKWVLDNWVPKQTEPAKP